MESFSAENEDEVGFKAGERIHVINKSMDGWWKIRYTIIHEQLQTGLRSKSAARKFCTVKCPTWCNLVSYIHILYIQCTFLWLLGYFQLRLDSDS